MLQDEENMTFEPMRRFLNSGYMSFHPTHYMPMNVFFQEFTRYCKANNYTAPRVKYGDIWREYNIHCAKRSLVWEGRKLRARFLMGVEPEI